ncbi:MAG: ABC transporter ATP-binding protein [Candidatus Galacturonibacter soehngenii]|nr:ABC transporter ATP-binding protein [Candidatus Galacturonibacter soehngenii]
MNINTIQCDNLSKSYGTFELSNISFSISKGQVVGLVGENGAGKTTLINLLLNKIKRDTGEITIFGKDLLSNEMDIKQKLGVVLDDSFLPNEFSVKEIQSFMKMIYSEWNSKEYYKYIDLFELPVEQKIGNFSKGMKRKLDIAVALSHEAKLLIFDEVTNGLDIVAQKMILDVLKDSLLKRDVAILLSTHNIIELKGIVNDIIMLNCGKISSIEDKKSLTENYFIVEAEDNQFLEIKKQYCVERAINENGSVRILLDKRINRVNYKEYKCRHAELEEVIYMKIKGE